MKHSANSALYSSIRRYQVLGQKNVHNIRSNKKIHSTFYPGFNELHRRKEDLRFCFSSSLFRAVVFPSSSPFPLLIPLTFHLYISFTFALTLSHSTILSLNDTHRHIGTNFLVQLFILFICKKKKNYKKKQECIALCKSTIGVYVKIIALVYYSWHFCFFFFSLASS